MSVLPGLRGHLIAASYLCAEISRTANVPDVMGARHRLVPALAGLTGLGPISTPKRILDALLLPLAEALELGALHDISMAGETLAATVLPPGPGDPDAARFPSAVAVVVSRWGDRLDRYWRIAVTEARRRRASWCLLCNGVALRIVHAERLYSRRFVEFDLSVAQLDGLQLAAALWRAASAGALFRRPQDPRSLHALVIGSERYAASVCLSLRDGVLAASAQVLAALLACRRSPDRSQIDDTFEQALTIVYRIVFLLFAEARGLVPLWHPVYRDSYSIESLRQSAERAGTAPGLWDALRAIARLAHAGCRAGDLTVTPFNGRLFSPGRTPLAERRGLDNGAARQAVVALSTRLAADRAGRERIAYAELGVEQLGAVYETLLDYQPRIHTTQSDGRLRAGTRVTLEPDSGVRKATGTFYTPQAIADYVVRRTLGPLVREASTDDILRMRVLDPAMGSGAFLVAACRFLATAYEDALVAAGGCHPNDIGEGERTAIRRLVAERCLYGVDVNPMAVQLARLSLWLATLAADRPLSFLDHRLVTGDSLLGAWLAQLRRPPAPGRRANRVSALPLFDDEPAAIAVRSALPVRFAIESAPNDTLQQVRTKERALATLSSRESAISRWKRVADLWCALWFGEDVPPAAYDALTDRILTDACALPVRTADMYLARADAVASTRRFFHWELEFPEAFFAEDGGRLERPGFDAVIGNPPWDMMRADAIAAAPHGSDQCEIAAAVRFTRNSGVYGAQSDGHANRYQLFVERAIALTRPGGRFGLVLPSGLAADSGSAPLRRLLFSTCDVDAIVGIDNRRRIFPIHRSVRFLLTTATAGRPTSRIACRFGVETIDDLHALEEQPSAGFPIHITRDALERLSGPALSIPDLRATVDLAVLEKAASLFSPLGSARGWHARFGRELNATDDRAAFRPGRRGLPIVDGKHLGPFRAAVEQSERSILVADARRLLGEGRVDRPRLAYRDVASATNRVTLIAAILPADCVSTHTVFCLRTPLRSTDQHLLCGLFNSFVVNFLVRLRVSTHVTTAIVEQLPVPERRAAPGACREIAALARVLARRWDEDAFALLNARVARIYQLSPQEFGHVLSTFSLVEARIRDRAMHLFVER